MTKVQLSQVGAVWDALPAPRPIPAGGEFHRPRSFVTPQPVAPAPALVAEQDTQVTEQPPAVYPAADIHPSTGCDRLNRQCEKHCIDVDDTVIHHGPLLELADPNGTVLRLRLAQWHDDPPFLEVEDTECDLDTVDKLIASLCDARHHLAAALGVAPPTEPPKTQQARPADGNSDGRVTA
jgi:hypothetical protein